MTRIPKLAGILEAALPQQPPRPIPGISDIARQEAERRTVGRRPAPNAAEPAPAPAPANEAAPRAA
jgi:hypothetical protein